MMKLIDIRSVIITVVALPVLYFLLRKLSKFLQKNLGKALDVALWVLGRVFQRSMARHVDFKRYARIQLEKASFRYLNTPGRFGVALETDRIFVPLTFETVTGELQTTEGLQKLGNRLRIVGDPGSGKTSLTKKMFREDCKNAVNNSRVARRLPIFIELKSFLPPKNITSESTLGKWALAKLKEQVTAVQGFSMAELFDSYTGEYGLDVFLDGLDEVASQSYERTAKAINELSRLLANKSGANRIILTMRVQFHQQVHSAFDDEFPPVVQIQPFSPGDIYTFLTRWPFRSDHSSNITRIYSDLTDRPTVRDMCTNPLVLAMYVANDQDSEMQSRSADTRTAFYNQVVEELLVTRRSRQLGVTARSALREQRESILGRLALENLANPDNPANVVPWTRAIEIIMSTYNSTRDLAITHLHELERDTGIISEERPNESLRFIHLTFCEYLAAKEYAQGRKDGWAELIASHSMFSSSDQPQLRTRLVEVIPFTIGLLARSQRPEALSDVVRLKDQPILGRCLLETQLYDSDAFQVYWKSESDYLINIEDSNLDHTGGEWLNRLHLFNVVLSDQAQWAAIYARPVPISLGEMFNQIVAKDRDRLTKVFSSYASQDPAASFRLAEATGVNLIMEHPSLIVDNIANPPFMDIAVERAQRQSEHIVNWALAFTEGSFRSPLVAARLNQVTPSAAISVCLENIDSKFRWYPFAFPIYESPSGGFRVVSGMRRWFIRAGNNPSPSLLTASLTLSASEAAMNPNSVRAVRLQFLPLIKPGGRLVPAWVFLVCASILILLPWGLVPPIGSAYHGNLPWTIFAWETLDLIIFTLLGLTLLLYPRERASIYWSLFRLSLVDQTGITYYISRMTSRLLAKLVFRKVYRILHQQQLLDI